MQYVNIDVDFFNHPKTVRLCTELGGHRSEVLPVKLWAHVAKYHSEDAFLKDYSPAAIAKILGWKEDAEKLVQALLNCGFIEQKRGGFKVHDFNEHNGHLALYKERGRIAAAARWSKYKPAAENKDTPQRGKDEKAAAVAFTDEQLNEIRLTLCKKIKSGMMSQNTQLAMDDLLSKLKGKKPRKPFNYALSMARNYGDKPK